MAAEFIAPEQLFTYINRENKTDEKSRGFKKISAIHLCRREFALTRYLQKRYKTIHKTEVTMVSNSIKYPAVMLAFLLAALFTQGFAQLELPRVSPRAAVSQTIGTTEISIDYCRPGVKGRVIWGELVPYDKVWRTGANEATKISFSSDVRIAGKHLKKGKYSLFTIPGREKWTVIFNNNTGLWGAMGYKPSEDALRISVTPEKGDFRERMMFYFTDLTDSSANAVLHWKQIMVPFKISVNVDSLILAEARTAISWQTPYQAASYVLEHNLDLQQGQKWLDISLAVEKNYWNTALKARYLHKQGNTRQAAGTLEEAIQMGKAMQQAPFNLSEMETMLKDWKK